MIPALSRRPETKQGRPADHNHVLQAVAAGLLGAVLLLPSLRAGWVLLHNMLLQNSTAALGRPSAGLAAMSAALRETWRRGQRMLMAAAMGVLSLRWELTPVSCSKCRAAQHAALHLAHYPAMRPLYQSVALQHPGIHTATAPSNGS